MKIIVSVQAPDINAKLDPRFGRAKYFLTIDTETMDWESHDNPANQQAHGAGVAAAQWVSNQDVDAVVSGDFGPNAVSVLRASGKTLYVFKSEQTVTEVLSSLANQQLQRF